MISKFTLLFTVITISTMIQIHQLPFKHSGDQSNNNLIQLGKSSESKFTFDISQARILQDNPFNPTGDFMTTTPGVKPSDDVLTIDLINQITQQNGSNVRPNITTNTTGPLYSIDLNTSSLNISLNGSIAYLLGNRSWIETSVDQQAADAAWIAAHNYLTRSNLSYFYPNQIILLQKQNNSLGIVFNATFRTVRGLTEALILIYQNYTGNLLSSRILNNIQTVSVNSNTILYNVTRSLLQSLFYDFTLNPLTLQNGTQTNYSDFTIYDLRYQSKNGIYSFIVKSKVHSNGSIVSIVLSCTPITISVATQTTPVLASNNIINVDGSFKYVNQTIRQFISKNLNISNFEVAYNSVIIWTNRAGSSILYHLNITVKQAQTWKNYIAAINYNLSNRQRTLSYWKNSSIIPPFNNSSKQYQQVPYLQVVTNSTFTNVDVSARTNYPTIVVGPLVKTELRIIDNKTSYKLTYFGIDGKNVQAAYSP